MNKWIVRSATLAPLIVLASCAAPPPPAPPPPPRIIAPAPAPMPMPYPPGQAAPNLVIPVTDLNGRRLTPNIDLTPEQALWQFRIGLNVAALNCRGPDEAILVANYSRFLTANRAAIARAERAVIAGLAASTGTNGISARDNLSTRLYNYFAQPPVQQQFCPVATNLTALASVEPTATILPFAATRIAELDQPFVDFYAAYNRYQADYARWQAQQPAAIIMPAVVPPSTVAPSPQPMPPTSGVAQPAGPGR
jgi:hypothetical protein